MSNVDLFSDFDKDVNLPIERVHEKIIADTSCMLAF
jgi:hypothetical protein